MATGRGTWWKQLSDYLHRGTDHRLRRLQIRAASGRVQIDAIAPTAAVREQAEQVARDLLPESLLSMRIRVDGDENPSDRTPPRRPREAGAPYNPDVCIGLLVYRRMQQLVNGN
jgi:hypothetical protein